MKSILNLVAICFTVALIGCSTTSTVSPAAMSECGAKDGAACVKAEGECCGAAKCEGEAASMGAVGSECEAKSECTKTCPVTGEASMGAVSECSVKTECAKSCDKADASMGAMSEETCATKKSCAAKKSCGSN